MSSIRPEDVNGSDPVTTNFAVQYATGGGFVADQIAPVMSVDKNYEYPRYDADELDQDEKAEVAPGDKPNESTFRAPTFVTGKTYRRAFDSAISRELKLYGVGPLARQEAHVAKLVHRIRLRVEKSVKALLDAGAYSANASVKFNAANPTIELEIDNAKDAFETQCGLQATHIIIPRAVANYVKRDASIRALRKFQNESLLSNGDIPNEVFGLTVIIPGAQENTANPGATQSIARVWSTDTCYLVHVNPSLSTDGVSATTIAQMRWMEWGTPYLGYYWPDPHVSKKVDWVSVDLYQNEELVAPKAIYRITDCL